MTRAAILLLVLPLAHAQVSIKVQVRSQNGAKVIDLPLERYVAAVLAGESSVFQSKEALKAMAVAARTYAVRLRGRHSAEGFDLCDTTHCQRIGSGGHPRSPGSRRRRNRGRIAVVPRQAGLYALHARLRRPDRRCGRLWPDLAEPYLKSHEDPYCARRGVSAWQWSADPQAILQALQRFGFARAGRSGSHFDPDRTPSDEPRRCCLLALAASIRISASSFRFAIGRDLGWNTLRRDHYEVHSSNGRIIFRRLRQRPRRGTVPARRGANGRGRPLLSRDSGVLLSGDGGGTHRPRALLAAAGRRLDFDDDHAA